MNLVTMSREFLPAPHLSLTLAGIFRDGGETAVEEEERSGRVQREDTTEISSENSGGQGNDLDFELGDGEQQIDDDEDQEEDGDSNNGNKKKKKRKKYHRHTPEQIKEMEALFKESPHPDEKQRLHLSKQLGLHPRQVKFWFQNRRTQIKAIQERHESSLLKTEIEKLRSENKTLREAIEKTSCFNCRFMASSSDSIIITGKEEQLTIENAKLKAEVEKLKSLIGKNPCGMSPNSSSNNLSGNDQENRNSFEQCKGIFGVEKSRIVSAANQALDELRKMAMTGEPLWVKSYETGREILNYDEYRKQFSYGNSDSIVQQKRAIEASKESGIVFVDISWLINSFMDANQWKELFPCLISKAATTEVIFNGEGDTKDGAVQSMFAEIQILTPMVATREMYFIRYCKQIGVNQWAITDVSINNLEDDRDPSSLLKCRKRPSGCIIEDKFNGHCKVTWVEHFECKKSSVHSMYRSMVNSGQAFGAKHWISTLQQQCERLVFFVATNVPTKDSNGVATLAGRKSMLKLAQRMTSSFCRVLGASSFNSWNKIPSKDGDDVRVASRKNLNDSGEPLGVILCASSCIWLPVTHNVIFDFLRDENQRSKWDIMFPGAPGVSIANLAKGQDRGNAVTVLAMNGEEHNMWVLQDCCINSYESMVVYAPVDINGMQAVMTGCDSSNIAILPSGFSILPDGIESRPSVISFRPEDKNMEGGSLLTIALQILIRDSLTDKLSPESVESVHNLISCVLQNIKKSLQCEY